MTIRYLFSVLVLLAVLLTPLNAQNEPDRRQPLRGLTKLVAPNGFPPVVAQFTLVEHLTEYPLYTRLYNGDLPGFSYHLDPGDDFRIELINHLKSEPEKVLRQLETRFLAASGLRRLTPELRQQVAKVAKATVEDKNNLTNFHTHGLHVSPKVVVNQAGDLIEARDSVLVTLYPERSETAALAGLTKSGATQGQTALGRLKINIGIPIYHAPGTHWYHAHLHGSTAIQVQNGMAGALIINEPEGQQILPNIEEEVLFIQDVAEVLREGNTTPSRVGTTVNGQLEPTVNMYPGQIFRFRILNAGSNTSGFKLLSLSDDTGKKVKFTVIAYDGITLNAPHTTDELFLAGGNRADILFQAPILDPNATNQEDTNYTLNANDFPFESRDNQQVNGFYPGPNGFLYNTNQFDQPPQRSLLPIFDENGEVKQRSVFVGRIVNTDSTQVTYNYKVPRIQTKTPLAHVIVGGVVDAAPLEIPTTSPEHRFKNSEGEWEKINYLQPIQDVDITKRRTMIFDVTYENGGDYIVNRNKRKLTIDGEQFSDDLNNPQVQIRARENTPPDGTKYEQGPSYAVEEWTVYNNSDQVHPFHIHVNPFQVMEIGYYLKTEFAETPNQVYTEYVPGGTAADKVITVNGANISTKSESGLPKEPVGKTYLLYHPRGWVKFRSRFNDFQGTYVLHCHILNHEDVGMMLSVNVGDKSNIVRNEE